MDVLQSLSGMLIKGLRCGLRCKDHLQLQNVPLEMSVISAQQGRTAGLQMPPAALQAQACWFGLCNLPQTKTIPLPQACSQNTEQNSDFVSENNGNRQRRANM